MGSVSFIVEDISFLMKGKRVTKKWIMACASQEGKELLELCYIFCSDSYLLKMNEKYLKHDTLTDTITFDYSSDKEIIIGDVFISIDRVMENATKFSVSFEEEINRVMIHGLLHLCGYSDKKMLQKKKMVERENFYLKLFNKKFHVKH
jgi:probable rRNA maturation factor